MLQQPERERPITRNRFIKPSERKVKSMCLNRRKNPVATLPVAMMFLAIGILWPHIIHTTLRVGENWDDFLRGGVIGIAIGILLLTAIRLHRQRRRCDGQES
jgi:hypothetical protein